MAGGADIATMKAILDTSGLRQGAKEGAAAMEQLAQGAEKVDAAMLAVRNGAVRMAGALGIYQFSQWIKGSIDLASRYETLGVVIQQIGKSAGYASNDIIRLTAALEKQGISMMQARQSVISMIQAKLDLAKADELAAVAQNAAVTAGLNSSETLQRIIYGITTGQTDVLRSVGIVTEFEGAYRKMAETLKKSTSELSASEKSQARVNAVIEAGIPIAGAYAASMDTAGKQARSMERYIEDLRVKLGQAFQPANTAMVFAMANAVKTLAENANLLIAVLGAVIGRSLVPLVQKFTEAGAVMIKNRAENAAYLEDMVRTATVQRTTADRRLQDLRAEQASIRSIMAVERQRISESTARIARAAPVGSLNALGSRVADRDNAEVAFAIKNQADARNALNAASERSIIVNGQIAAANATVAATTNAVTVAQRAQAVATSFVTKAIAGLSTVYNLLGGALGITLMAIAAFYTTYSAAMQKAKEEIDANADAISKKLDEISAKRAKSFNLTGEYNPEPTNNYNKKVKDLTDSFNTAQDGVRTKSMGLTEVFKDLFTNMSGFGRGIYELDKQLRNQEITVEEAVSGIDALANKYPNMAEAAERAKERVALFAIKQDELNKFMKESTPPLLAAAAAMDLYANASKAVWTDRGLIKAEVPKFIQANLGDKGRDTEREISDLKRMQEAIKTGNKEIIQSEQDRQTAERVAQALIDERVKGNEKLASVLGKTRTEIAAMGPVANEAIAQLQIDSDATFKNEQRKLSLARANEQLTGAQDKQLRVQRETRAFLERASGRSSQTPDEIFEDSVTDYKMSMRDNQSAAATNAAVKQAREMYRIQTLQRDMYKDMDEWERKRLITVDKTAKALKAQADIMANFKSMASGIKSVDEELSGQKSTLFNLRNGKNNSVSQEQLKELYYQEMINAKYKEYSVIIKDSKIALGKAEQFVKDQREIDKLIRSTQKWADTMRSVGNSFMDLSEILQTVGDDSVRILGATGSAINSISSTMERVVKMKKDPANNPRLSGAESAVAGVGGTIAAFSAGYSFGRTTTNRTTGAVGGAISGASTGAAIGTAINPGIGTAIGAGVGAIVGGIGGLLGAVSAGKQAESQMKLNAKKLGEAMDALKRTLANDSLGAAIAQVKSQFNDLRKAAEDSYQGTKNEPQRNIVMKEIAALEAKQIEQTKKDYEFQARLEEQSLEARGLRSRGLEEEARLMDVATNYANEMNNAIKKYGEDSSYVEKLREVQKAEEARTAMLAKESDRRAIFDLSNATLAITDPRNAGIAAIQEENARRIFDAIQRGASEAEKAAIALYNTAVLARAEADRLEQDRRTTEGFIPRVLSAIGNSSGARAATFAAGQRQEMEDAIRSGMSDTNQAILAFVQFAEREAEKTRIAIEAGTKAINEKADAELKALDFMIDTIRDVSEREIKAIDAEMEKVSNAARAQAESYKLQTEEIRERTKAQVDAISSQIEVARSSLEIQQEQLAKMEQQVAVSQRVVDSLDNFSKSLLLGDMSTLSPEGKLAEALRQFEDISRAALGGDADAAQKLPEAANAFLQTSRSYNASSPAYTEDFNRVMGVVNTVREQFGKNLPVDVQQLEAMRAQVRGTEGLINSLGKQQDAIQKAAQKELDVIEKAAEEASKAAEERLKVLQEQRDLTVKNAEEALKKLDEQRQALIKSTEELIKALVKTETEKLETRIKENEFYGQFSAYALESAKFQENALRAFRNIDPKATAEEDSTKVDPKLTVAENTLTSIQDLAKSLSDRLDILNEKVSSLITVEVAASTDEVMATNQVTTAIGVLITETRNAAQANVVRRKY